MEGVLAILLIFGIPGIIGLSFTPLGKAVTERIRYGPNAHLPPETDPEVLDELERLRGEVTELQERVDFAERLLARQRETPELGAGNE